MFKEYEHMTYEQYVHDFGGQVIDEQPYAQSIEKLMYHAYKDQWYVCGLNGCEFNTEAIDEICNYCQQATVIINNHSVQPMD